MHFSNLRSLALVAALAACGPDKETPTTSSATATVGETTEDATAGMSGPNPGVTTTGSPEPTPTTDPTDGATSSVPVTSTTFPPGTTEPVETTDPTATGGDDCQFELPPPGQCDGGKPLHPRPELRAGAAGQAVKWTGQYGVPDEEPLAGTSTGVVFIEPFDAGGGMECDIFTQDCGPGEKCNPFADDGGTSWNATKCVPVAPNPDPVGSPCTAESGLSGIDSCVKGAMCWNVDDLTGQGVCNAHCTCSIDNPICEQPQTVCAISNGGVLAVCLDVCDPLESAACPESQVCIMNPGDGGLTFVCVNDASGESGKQGDPCSFLNDCDPGHFCADASVVPGCQESACCTALCDLDAGECPQGASCVPFHEGGSAPKCLEDLGACVAQ